MLEFYCVLIFIALAGSSVWLIHALEGLMESEP